MSKGAKIANGMLDFATGVYRNIDNKAASKAMKNGGQDALNAFNASKKTGAHKAGIAFANSKPMQGMTGTARQVMKAKNAGQEVKLGQAIKKGHSKTIINDAGQKQEVLSKSKIAGTVATVGVAGRVASGGGLYRDKYGNVNLPGIPFI
ncbi:MAG: hypothetical protein ACRC4Q_08150 [Paraclostridium dentum]